MIVFPILTFVTFGTAFVPCIPDYRNALMTSIKLKLTVGAFVLLLAVSYLAIAGVKKGWVYFMPLDQFVADPAYQDRRVRLNGKVAVDDLQIDRAGLVATFNLQGDHEQVRVQYHGVIPDMFRAHHEVIVEGQLGSDHVFHADLLMTKCASKYQTGEGHSKVNAESQP
ncbi:hypothetical protein BH10PLA1_BH10PLA1_03200 [soil metagenome]